MREHALQDYIKTWGYFTNWLKKNYGEIQAIDQLTTEVLRISINYMERVAKRIMDA
ncbi:hypothetical protein [Thermaerobacillus caldiproteolyticus]|uniref:Uncharacterized protein n=1 Tax=Thermaerobacillus caldiproteolyticus TaxID=247480 RepID=A0A7V9Z801_9BACL|nr:hypothetical protein [Anoxybacillus caldiproteolyticus]MBA2875623.1 hypothetical protein [Anoxybacillus caldiproteolyticus]QPA30538.1 hypothetical protein ISX45_13200 [Anoxybacillus caldiproteolyticus]